MRAINSSSSSTASTTSAEMQLDGPATGIEGQVLKITINKGLSQTLQAAVAMSEGVQLQLSLMVDSIRDDTSSYLPWHPYAKLELFKVSINETAN